MDLDPAALFDVRGKVVLVTGGSRGIGEMMVRGFHAAGATVFVSSRGAEACQALVDELGERAHAVPGDVATADGCRAIAAAVNEATDGLDVLVNNAGASWGAPIDEYPEHGFDKVLDVNVKGLFYMTQACLGMLRVAAAEGSPARVINIGSIDGILMPMFESYAYSASKAAVHQLTRHMGKRLASDHITVNAIAPGLFESKMTAVIFEGDDDGAAVASQMPLGRAGKPSDMAGAAIFLASAAASWITGAVLPVDGGFATLR